MMDLHALLLSARGRIGRKAFWIGVMWLFLAAFVLSLPIGLWGTWAEKSMPAQEVEQRLGLMKLALNVALFYPSLCLNTKRLHDHGRSGWWQLLPAAFITPAMAISALAGGPEALSAKPGLALLVLLSAVFGLGSWLGMFVYLGFAKGADAENRYGKPGHGEGRRE